MEKKNSLKRMIAPVAGVGLAITALAGCANYSGNGNEFVVEGTVTDPGKQSLKVRILDIEETHGEANGWFDEGHVHQLHDNCDCHGAFTGRKTYGEVYNQAGQLIEPGDVAIGSCVRLIGKIRDSSEGKYTSTRPVFDEAYIVDCSTI